VEQAVLFGYDKIAITDRNTFAGIVRAHAAARKKEIKIIPGCRLESFRWTKLISFIQQIRMPIQDFVHY
jgi:error-prone DNA polymerase